MPHPNRPGSCPRPRGPGRSGALDRPPAGFRLRPVGGGGPGSRTLCLALLAGCFAGFLLPAGLRAQASTATLRGQVLEAGSDAPLPSARVELLGTHMVAVSDSSGRFVVTGLHPGVVEVRVRYLGLGDQRWEVPLQAGVPTSIVFRVQLGVIPVPGIHVTIKQVVWPIMRGFEYRMKHDDGVFITRSEIERRQPQDLSDLLRTVPGLTFEPPSTEFGDTRVRMGHGRLQCTPTLYMDGHRITAFHLDDFRPEHIEAMEIYTSMATVPGEFRIGPARCGAIVLWSRNTF